MPNHRLVGLLALTVMLLVIGMAGIVAFALISCLTEYGIGPQVAGGIVFLAGCALAAKLGISVSKWLTTGCRCAVTAGAILLVILLPLLAMIYPGRVTYARFGLTVYGIVPVPILDVTVGPHGILWFRDKTHHVTAAEVRALISPDVEMVIIGTGWRERVQVDSDVNSIQGIRILRRPTPEAVHFFNLYRSQGRKVVLLAHSTC